MAPPSKDERQIRPFADVLREIDGGLSADEAARALDDCVAAATERGVKTELTVKIVIEPDQKGTANNLVKIAATATPKIPPVRRRPSPMFVTAQGHLTRENPAQMTLGIRIAEPTAADERVVEPVERRVVGGEA